MGAGARSHQAAWRSAGRLRVAGGGAACCRYLAKYAAKALDGERIGGLHRYEVAQGFTPRALSLEGETADDVSPVPVLALAGGADPQDPVANLSDLRQHFPDSRTVVFPHIGHQFGIGACVDPILADFVERGTTRGLDTTGCDGAVRVPPFELAG